MMVGRDEVHQPIALEVTEHGRNGFLVAEWGSNIVETVNGTYVCLQEFIWLREHREQRRV